MKCKACGYPLIEACGIVYCPHCRVKRTIPAAEIDRETGEWEGMYT